MTDEGRGEKQRLEHLLHARKHLEEAIACHKAGMSDPAESDAMTAEAHLEDYRKGSRLRRADQ